MVVSHCTCEPALMSRYPVPKCCRSRPTATRTTSKRVLSRGNICFRVRSHTLDIRRTLCRASAECELSWSAYSRWPYTGSQFMDQSKSLAGAAGVLLACVFVVSSAFAAEPDTHVRTENVMFQDLNLAHAAGVDALYKRIHAAAQRVCAASGPVELVFLTVRPSPSAPRTRRLGRSKK